MFPETARQNFGLYPFREETNSRFAGIPDRKRHIIKAAHVPVFVQMALVQISSSLIKVYRAYSRADR